MFYVPNTSNSFFASGFKSNQRFNFDQKSFKEAGSKDQRMVFKKSSININADDKRNIIVTDEDQN